MMTRTMLLAIVLLGAQTVLAQEIGGRRAPPPDVALVRLDELSLGLAMDDTQARAYAVLRAAAAKVAADMPARSRRDPFASDPFPAGRGIPSDAPKGAADRTAFRLAGSRFFATLDDARKTVVSREWRPVLAAFMHQRGGPHGHHGNETGGGMEGPPR